MDVDEPVVGIAVAGLEAFQPKDAGDDGIAAGGVHGQDFAGGAAGFEDFAGGLTGADLPADAQEAERRAVGAKAVAEAELRGGDGIARDGRAFFEQDQALVVDIDDQDVAVVPGAAGQEEGGDGGGQERRRVQAGVAGAGARSSVVQRWSQKPTDFEAT